MNISQKQYLREANDDDEEITFIIKYGCETNLKKKKQINVFFVNK